MANVGEPLETRKADELPYKNIWVQAAGLAFVVFLVYLIARNESSPYNQYVLLADAFLKGRLYLIDPGSWLEVAQYGQKAFVVDPPAPTLFLIPVVAVLGVSFDQTLVSMAVGAAAVALFWIAARQMGWDPPFALAMTALVGFGTDFWWAATDGSLWTFSHVSAVFFLMAALVEATGSKRPWLVGILLGLAGLSRLPTFLCFPLYAYLISDGQWQRRNLVPIALLLAPMVLFGLADLLYNYGRFGTWRDMGYYHPRYDSEPWFSRGRFDIAYIPRHINAIFFMAPVLQEQFPYFKPSFLGLSLFFTTPAFLYAFNSTLRPITLAALAGLLLTAIPLMTHGTTGWTQFGYRFSLDMLPELAILTAAGMRYRLNLLIITVIAASCGINFWGALAFHRLDWVASF